MKGKGRKGGMEGEKEGGARKKKKRKKRKGNNCTNIQMSMESLHLISLHILIV